MKKLFALSIPVSAIWKQRSATQESIKVDLSKFNKTHALFLCAKLNLITASGRTYENNRDIAQNVAFQLLRSDRMVSGSFIKKLDEYRQKTYREENKLAIVFTREGLLEMIRALCLWGNSEISVRNFLGLPHTQDAFFSALLTSTEFFLRRYARFLPDTEEVVVLEGEELEQFRWNKQPMMRIMSEFTPPIRDPLYALGRAQLLLIEEFFDENEVYANEFRRKHEGLSMEQYLACATSILSVSLAKMRQDEQVDSLRNSFLFTEEIMFSESESMREPFKKYLKCKGQSVEELSKRFQETFRSIDDLLSVKPIRERPILLDNGVGVVLDEKLFAESVSVGPLFSLLKNDDKNWNRQVFSEFGKACHRYAHRIIEHYYQIVQPVVGRQVISEPEGIYTIESKQKRSLGDSLVIENSNALLFEIKGTWFNETALKTADSFWAENDRLYGVSMEDGDEKRQGYAQLADVIKAFALGELVGIEKSETFNQVDTIIPVLLAHDELVHQINLARHLAKLFMKEFDLEDLPESGMFVYHGKKIHSLITLSFSDLEMMQAKQLEQGMNFYLEQYSAWSPDRENTLYEFYLNQFSSIPRRPKEQQFLLKAASQKLSEVAMLCFGQPLPE